MTRIADSISDIIGNTPLVELHHIEKEIGFEGRILAKLEALNPSASVKIRIAREMIDAAEKTGQLKPGGTIIEGTSGNTGIGLAAIGASRGYHVILVMPDNMSVERMKLAKAYGAEVVLTPREGNMGAANARAKEILEHTPNAVIAGQGANPNNPGAHYRTTGPEIWRDTGGEIDILVATTGTGGTISGSGKFLREKKPSLRIYAVEPAGSPVLNGGKPGPHKIQGIGGGATPPVTDVSLFDGVLDITDDDACSYARKAAETEGLLVGISSGAALAAAVQVAKRPENAKTTIVTVFPDSGERYLSTDLYDV